MHLRETQQQIQNLLDQPGEYRLGQIRQAFQDCMTAYCGVFRTQELMQTGLQNLEEIRQRSLRVRLDDQGNLWNTEIIEAFELRNLMIVGELIMTGALQRQESRGAHFREDFPQRDDTNFLKHTLAYYSPAGIEIQYMPVTINLFQPQERKY